MAIVKILAPSSSPLSIDDYKAQNNQIIELIRNLRNKNPVRGLVIAKGSVLAINGAIFMVDNDTDITGNQTKYVKITPAASGLSCSASFVANLTGVSWSEVYNGYYDASGNLYLFNESMAINDGVLASGNTIYSRESFNTGVLYPDDSIDQFIHWRVDNILPVDDGYSISSDKMIIGGSGNIRVKALIVGNSAVNVSVSVRIMKNSSKIYEENFTTFLLGVTYYAYKKIEYDTSVNKNDIFYAQIKYTPSDYNVNYMRIQELAFGFKEL